ncbi:hypothetical protein BB560_006667 [Smittium megazygosporum]|uniref:Thioredoxin domain-containing protein n=1 Tax=Smittium megazygosporum TaxID=133381 RepID=A0A2T9Y2J7_9FUNG|nr:hypothetical protein BB560_006667 [Smittium megazygosporum]
MNSVIQRVGLKSGSSVFGRFAASSQRFVTQNYAQRMYSSGATGGQIEEGTNANFKQLVLDSKAVVTLVDFYADWCGPCRMLGPLLERVVKEGGKVNLVKVNVDNEQELGANYEITNLPTVVAFHNGNEIDRFLGFRNQQAVEEFINKLAK